MNQEIIALSIVFLAAAYAIYSIAKALFTKSSSKCSDSCACSAKTDLKIMLKKHAKMNGTLQMDTNKKPFWN